MNSAVKPLVIAHEAYHVANEFLGAGPVGIALCDGQLAHEDSEIAAWLGPALFMVPPRLLRDIADSGPIEVGGRIGVAASIVAAREAIGVMLGELPGNTYRSEQFARSCATYLSSWSFARYRDPLSPSLN